MTSIVKQSRRIVTIVMWCAAALAETPDLSPLLPAPTPDTQAIREALLAGDASGAERLLGSLDPGTSLRWRGILAIVGNNPHAAIRALRRTDEPKLLGVAYYLARQYLLFRDQMLEAIRRNPSDFGPYYYLGRYYNSDVDNAADGERWFREALRRNPGYERARAHLGNCLELMGRTDEAEAEYHAAASVPLAQLGLARIRQAAGDYEGALKLAQKAQANDPLNAAAPKLAARVYSALNRPRDSIHSLEAAALLDPRDASTQYQLYRAYQSTEDTVKAASALREFERLHAVYGLGPQ